MIHIDRTAEKRDKSRPNCRTRETLTSWLQALFPAILAATITDLTVVDVGTQYTLFGQMVLLLLIQLGGIGLLTFGIFILHLSNGRLRLRDRAVLRDAFNQSGSTHTGRYWTHESTLRLPRLTN